MGLPNGLIQNPNPQGLPQINSVGASIGTNIADILYQKEKISADDLKAIKFEAVNSGKSIKSLIIEKGLATEEEIIEVLSGQYGIPFIDLTVLNIPTELIQKIPRNIAEQYRAIAFGEDGSNINVAMEDPLDLQKVKFIQALIGRSIKPHFASASDIDSVINTKYGAQVGQEVEQALEEVDEDVIKIQTNKLSDVSLDSQISNAPVSKIVNMVLEYAIRYKSSDIHIEPRENKVSVRYRVNGVMAEKLSLPVKLAPPVISRVKIMADLKIDEHRVPQDGRFQMKVDDKSIDIRVSIVPTIYGEKVVMRLLERDGNILSLEKTGLRGSAYKTYIEALKATQGIILITGPTGSGKTQTLASSLHILNTPDVNIMTLEDPVEIRIDGVNQIQVNQEVGLTFSKGLRSFLRQDPDIIMVGEIRDKETAELAIQASLTGHLVLATLHTNSAAGALTRLFDMGIPPYLLASTINVVVGQRLVRTITDRCRRAVIANDAMVAQIQSVLGTIQGYDIYKIAGDPDKIELFDGGNCEVVADQYSGRIGIFEVMKMNDKLSQLVIAQRTEQEIEREAIASGMITMVQDGFMKALEGVTTIEEVMRVIN